MPVAALTQRNLSLYSARANSARRERQARREGDMNFRAIVPVAFAALVLAQAASPEAVAAPAINCAFDASCTVCPARIILAH